LPSIAKKARLQSFAEDQHDSAGGFAGGDIACPDPDTSAAGFNLSSVSSLQQQQGVLPSSSSQQYSQVVTNPFLDTADARRAFVNPFLDVAAARRALPSLHDQPDDYLRSQSYGDLVRANATLAKADQKNSALTALDRRRMAVNVRELKAKPIRIEASWDDIDSLSQLHPARFIQGPPCSLKKLWQTARGYYS
jgi:hypothetical protein